MSEIVELLLMFAIAFGLSEIRAVRAPLFRAIERVSIAIPGSARVHAPLPSADMRERYDL